MDKKPDINDKAGLAARQTRTPMPEQPPKVRARNFEEVPLGYTPEMAVAEAKRCLQCKRPLCMQGCPVNVNIPEFLQLIVEEKFAEAAQKVKETNALPAVCGRVCPQETQCEEKCILGRKFEPVAIGRCERFVADYERNNKLGVIPEKLPLNGKKVAIVGAGPAGLTAAGDLVLLGYDVTIFEAFHRPGGVLMYGIPEFRLPKEIVECEVNYLTDLGAKLELNQLVGKVTTVDEMLREDGFDAVFVGVGAGLPSFLNIPGEDLGGICSANEYLTRSNLMKAYDFPNYDTPVVRGKTVSVVGGGNVAMDAARTALRLGADTVRIVYRRSRAELPARLEEIHHAEEEGIEFLFLTNPVACLGDDRGMVRQLQCVKMELGEPDDSGRQRPIVIQGSDFLLDTDLMIIAAGGSANPILTKNTENLELNKWGYIVCTDSGRTKKERVWAGGDIVTGAATVINAMGAGKVAAADIHDYLSANSPGSWL